jgi:hypothetical protein
VTVQVRRAVRRAAVVRPAAVVQVLAAFPTTVCGKVRTAELREGFTPPAT